jgi:hypothetical protein
MTVLRIYMTASYLSDGAADLSDGCGLIWRMWTYLTVLQTYLTASDLSNCAADLSDGFGLI